MNVEDAAKFKDLLAKELARLDTTYKGAGSPAPTYGGYHEAAAVLASFDPDALKPSGLAPPEAHLEEVLVNCTLGPDADGQSRWTLMPNVRTDVLGQLATREKMLQALAANPDRPQVPLQQMLEAYVRGAAPPLEAQNLPQLAATFQVGDWLRPVLPDVPSRDAITQQIDLTSLLRPFDDLAGTHFSGRKKELNQLRQYVEVLSPDSSAAAATQWLKKGAKEILSLHEKPPLLIHGPGGMGKSTLVSRFILEHVRLDAARRFPFVYLDFDRPDLGADEPITLLIEAVRQLGLQYPHARQACERLRSDWQGRLADAARQRPAVRRTSKRGSAPLRLDRAPFLDSFRSLLGTLDLARKPILFVLDTFEEVQYSSPAGVQEVLTFLGELQAKVPRLRVVLAGRAQLLEHSTESLPLGELDAEAAQAYLQGKGVADPAIAQHVVSKLGGNPLTLRLAAEVFEKEGVEALEVADGLGSIDIQRQLFRRILHRIHDPEVRKLAHPGLVLRRVTPELIRDVLAAPCGVEVPDLARAEALFNELRREIAVVAPDEGRAVRHRPELRRIMLPLLEQDQPDTVREIHQRAIAYYQSGSDPVARAEEIYHRLSLEQPHSSIDARWIPGVEPHLASALEDLGPIQRAYLASHLGVEVDRATRAEAAIEDWQRDAERRVRDWLAHGHAEQALAVLAERPDRPRGTVLDGLEAQALEQLARVPEATSVLDKAIEALSDGRNPELLGDLLLKVGRLLLRTGDHEAAQKALDHAGAVSADRGPLYALEVMVLRRDVGVLRKLLETLTDEELAADPLVLRKIARLLEAEDSALLARILRLVGLDTITPRQCRVLSLAVAAWDAEVSKQRAEPPGVLARAAGLKPLEKLSDTWQWLGQQPPRQMVSALVPLLEKYPLAPINRAVAVDLNNAIVDVLAPAGVEPAAVGPRRASERSPVASAPKIRLTSGQMRRLSQSVIEAFPDVEKLDAFLRFRLDRNRSAISLHNETEAVVVDVIQDAQVQGWTAELLTAAREAAPQNAGLQAIAEEVGLISAFRRRDLKRLEHLARPFGRFVDINEWRARLGEIEPRVCRVEVEAKQGKRFSTGFLLSPDLVMTVYHVVEDAIISSTTPNLVCRFDYKTMPGGRAINPGTEFRLLATDWLVDYSPYHPSDGLPAPDGREIPDPDTLDYALLRLEGFPGAEPVGGDRAEPGAPKRGWIDVPPEPYDFQPDTPLFIVQHPSGQPLKLAFDAEAVQEVNANRTRVSYRIATEAGSAGSPCFSNDWDLVAMHHAARIERGAKLNQGVPISTIRARLARRGLLDLLGGRGFA